MDDVETLDRASHVALVLGFSDPGTRRMENMQFVGLQACGISILSCWVDLVSGQLQLSFRRVNLAHGNVHDANGRTSLASQGCSWSSGPGCGPAPGIDRDTASVTRPGYPGPTWMAVTVTRTGPRSIRCISCALPGPVKTVIACCGVPLARRQLPPWPGPARRSLIQSHGKVLTLKRQLDVTLSFPRPQADAASGLRFSRPGPRPPRLRLRHDWFDRTRLSQLWLRVVTIWSYWPGGTAGFGSAMTLSPQTFLFLVTPWRDSLGESPNEPFSRRRRPLRAYTWPARECPRRHSKHPRDCRHRGKFS